MVDLKKKTLIELQDDFNSLTRKRNQLILDVDKITKELIELSEKVYEASSDYVKITCINCNGDGIVPTEDGKKVICKICNRKKYMWVRKFQEEKENGN